MLNQKHKGEEEEKKEGDNEEKEEGRKKKRSARGRKYIYRRRRKSHNVCTLNLKVTFWPHDEVQTVPGPRLITLKVNVLCRGIEKKRGLI